jgi:CDP-diacylglycerol pyrophosphatase
MRARKVSAAADGRLRESARVVRTGSRFSGRARLVMAKAAALVAVAVVASSCAELAAADPDALWKIVGGQCVPEARASGHPGQCTSVDLADHYAILKDISGRSQHLLIPTERVTGIESPSIVAPDAPDYWADGWSSRNTVEASLKKPLAADQFGLEINSEFRRSQQQLHIHMDCMRTDIIDALAPYRHDQPGQWQWETIDGVRYRIMRVTSLSQDNDPFRIVARDHPDSQSMATQTILVTGAGPSADQDGWLVLNSGLDVDNGTGTAEGLLDHECHLADAH